MRKLDPCMIPVPGFHIYNHCGTDLTIDKIIQFNHSKSLIVYVNHVLLGFYFREHCISFYYYYY